MIIVKAHKSDLDALLKITRNCAKQMIAQGIFQWNESYPSKSIFEKDIELSQIWKLKVENEIVGMIVLTEIEDEEYQDVSWLTPNNKNLYVHRLAVNPKDQGKGYARILMDFAEEYAEEHNYESIRLDTFSQNKRNQKFYELRNYQKLDNIFLPNQSEHPFYCYEKVLNV